MSVAADDARRAELADRLHTGRLTKEDSAQLAEMFEAWRTRSQSVLEGWMTRPQVAKMLGVSVSTVARWEYQKTGPICVKVGRTCWYAPSDVANWLDERAEYKRRAHARHQEELAQKTGGKKGRRKPPARAKAA